MSDNYVTKDANLVPVTFKTKDVGGGIQSSQVIISDAAGVPYDATHKFVVDGSTVTQPISALSLPLPVGAATDSTAASAVTALGQLHTDLTGTLNIAAVALPLPAGAATSAKQDAAVSALGQLHADLATGTLNIAAAALPLPAGAATSAKQDAAVSSLNQLHTDLTGTLNVAAAALPLPAGAATASNQTNEIAAIGQVKSSVDGQALVIGTKTDSAAADDTSSASIVAIMRRGLSRWTSLLSILGAAADAAWDGIAATPSIISVLKAAAASLVVMKPFSPIKGSTIALTAGPTSTVTPVALAANVATSYRVRNAAASASPIAWKLSSVAGGETAVVPTAYTTAGTGGTVGDKSLDPGGVEIIGLSAAQQTALAAGTLYLSVVTAAGGSGTLYITPGNGA